MQLGMSKAAGLALSWGQRSDPKRNTVGVRRAKLSRTVAHLARPANPHDEAAWDAEDQCDTVMARYCDTDSREWWGAYQARPQELPGCDLPDCPTCWAGQTGVWDEQEAVAKWRQHRTQV